MKKGCLKKRRNIFCVSGGVLIAAGILVAAYPFWKEAEEARQQELLKRWEMELKTVSFAEEPVYVLGEEPDAPPGNEEDVTGGTGNEAEAVSGADTVGVLRIPAINLEQPVLRGATVGNLSIAPSTVEPADQPGTNGNFSVAGHNSRTYGRHFNRLKELTAGDEIEVETADGVYTYSVVSSYIVEPDEVWVLEHRLEEPEITLITCDYSGGGEPRRLVVKGVLVQ